MAGYSGTPLLKKLGIKDGHRVLVRNAPASLPDELAQFAEARERRDLGADKIDVAVLFSGSVAEFKAKFAQLFSHLHPNGALWIAWPKKASGTLTDLNDNLIREHMLTTAFVDVKVCAIDETWSGLKLVVRKERRAAFAAQTQSEL
jgi:hypothetical protein